jgi:4-amino-4-deoxy-L-arabinose transferase-like glycosyltransferase
MGPDESAAIVIKQRRQSLILGCIALLLFLVGSDQQSAIGFDSRFVLFAQEMLRHGPSIFPTTYSEPYADYLATSTFFSYLLSLPFGQVTMLTARLPSAIGAAVIVMLMYRLVAPHSKEWALASIAILLLSVTFVSESRAVSLDMMLASVSFAAFYLIYAADHFDAPRRQWLLLFCLLLGFVIRGPIGLVVPAGIVCSYYLLASQWRRLLSFGLVALLILMTGIGLLLCLGYISGGAAFVQEVIRMQVTGRIDGSEGASSAFYYFSGSLGNYALAYPLAIAVLVAVGLVGRSDKGPALSLFGYCLAAGLLVMVGLSVPLAKKARYVLPMLPMVAIVAAYPFQGAKGLTFSALRNAILGVWLFMPLLLMVGLLVVRQRLVGQLPTLTWPLLFLAGLQCAGCWFVIKPRWRVKGLAALATLAVWFVYIRVFEPVEQILYDTRQFSESVYRTVNADAAPLVLHGLGKDAKAIKFMVNINQDLRPIFTQTPAELEALRAPAYIVMSQEDLDALPETCRISLIPMLNGMFDKDPYVLLHTRLWPPAPSVR